MNAERRKRARELLEQVKAQTWDAADPERFEAESDLFVEFIAAAPELLAEALNEIDRLRSLVLAIVEYPVFGTVTMNPDHAWEKAWLEQARKAVER